MSRTRFKVNPLNHLLSARLQTKVAMGSSLVAVT